MGCDALFQSCHKRALKGQAMFNDVAFSGSASLPGLLTRFLNRKFKIQDHLYYPPGGQFVLQPAVRKKKENNDHNGTDWCKEGKWKKSLTTAVRVFGFTPQHMKGSSTNSWLSHKRMASLQNSDYVQVIQII